MTALRFVILVAGAIASSAFAQMQQGPPHIGYVFPAGAQQGTSIRVVVGGQFLLSPTEANFSGDGIDAAIVEHFVPLNGGQAAALRDRITELSARKSAYQRAARQASSTRPTTTATWTADDERTLGELLKRIATFRPKLPSPAIAETVTLDLKIAPNAEPGPRTIRLSTVAGLTNPLTFHVGILPEACEQEINGSVRATEMPVRSLPAVLNGQVMPGDVDRYRFTAKKGQKVVAAVSARELIPYIADAVPGWFQATLAVYGSDGKQLAFTDDFRCNPDPAMCFDVPADGEYVLEIRDSIYRGREDFVYRIAIGELPFVTGVFPLGAQAGQSTKVRLTGWNLPTNTLTTGRDLLPLPEGVINRVPFAFDALPDGMEREPNDSPAAPQQVELGTMINGVIGRPGDWDCFRVNAKAGEQIVAEVSARRLNSPLDSQLRVTDSAGQTVAFNDDTKDPCDGRNTHHADSYISFKAPSTDAYFIQLGDTQGKGGDSYSYRLRISRPAPDYELIVSPASVTTRPGGVVPLSVQAVRRDGFDGEIRLSLAGEAGYQIDGALIPKGQERTRITLTVPTSATTRPVALQLSGSAEIGGKTVAHRATPAEDMMQAFAYRHLVPVDQLEVLATGRPAPRTQARVVSKLPIRMHVGGSEKLIVAAPANSWWGPVSYVLSEPPEGLSIVGTTPTSEGNVILLRSDSKSTKPFQGNLIINGYAQPRNPSTRPAAGNTQPRLILTLPAIPCEILK